MVLSQLWHHFLGDSPTWYKALIVSFLLINPLLLLMVGKTVVAWLLLLEFIITLMMALHCYPLQAGGLLVIEGIVMGLSSSDHIYHEVIKNFEVILLLMFMVAGIYFLRELLLLIFTYMLLNLRNRYALSLVFLCFSAVFSAFLDALTVTAILIIVFSGCYVIYTEFNKTKGLKNKQEAEDFKSALRSLVMHSLVGTALGGVCTMVGEPQNLLIAERMGWNFREFFLVMAPITMPVLAMGMLCCLVLERFRVFGYGATIPESVHLLLDKHNKKRKQETHNIATFTKFGVQGLGLILLVLALAFHVAPIGLIGLSLIVLMTAINGITKEHDLVHAFQEAMPFTALLVVFFAMVSIINDQNLFTPVLDTILQVDSHLRPTLFYIANGVLSAVSDNVFVATTYMEQLGQLVASGKVSVAESEKLAVAINTGTNIPSIATPNGQAAFLFLLTSALATTIQLSYFRMLWHAMPYTIVLGITGLLCVYFLL